MSGSLGNVVTSRNRAGQYQRARVSPLNPQSPAQQNRRSALASIASAWRGLTSTARAAWEGYAVSKGMVGTGFNAYVSVNGVLALTGAVPVVKPPQPAAFGLFTATGLTATVDEQANTLALSVEGAANTEAPDCYIVEATAPASAGKSNLSSNFRVISGSATIANLGGATGTLGQAYASRYGVPAADLAIQVRVTPVKDGQKGVPFTFATITAAA